MFRILKLLKNKVSRRNLKITFFAVVLFFIAKETLVIQKVLQKPDVNAWQKEVKNSENKIVTNDVTQLNKIEVEKVFTPKTVEELQEIIKNTTGKISIAGSKKSMGGQSATFLGTQIDMSEFNKILFFSTSTKEITAQAGARWYDLQKVIDPENLSIMIMQSYNNFSIGGSLSTNVHGRYIGYGPMIESIKSFRIVLADGSLVEASREENSDIFYAAIGGYGAFGVITDISLKLADNVNVKRKVERIEVGNYTNYFNEKIKSNKNIVFQNADIYLDDYKVANSVVWEKIAQEPTVKERFFSKEEDYPSNRLAWHIMSEWWGGKYLRKYILDKYMFKDEAVHTRNYEASYDVSELEPSSRKNGTYVLQEYFILVDKINEFIPKMKTVFEKHDVNVLNISIRHAKKDEGATLSWAKEEVFAFVIYYKQGTTVQEKNKVGEWSREMIDEIIKVNGSYYLPYQPWLAMNNLQKFMKTQISFLSSKKNMTQAIGGQIIFGINIMKNI